MDISQLSDEEILDIANPLMDNIIAATIERDYEKLSRDFTQRLKHVVTKAVFEQQLAENTLGEFGNRELLSIIHKKDVIFVLWKQWFTHSTDEFLAEIIIVYQEDRFLVDHDWFR